MSHLRLLLSTACRQYASLTLNRCSGSASVLKTNLHYSPCLNIDVGSLIDGKEQKDKPAEQKTAEKRVFYAEAPVDPEYLPGGEYIPTASTYEHMVDGIRFDELPRIYINATYQNTIISAHTKTNDCLSYQSGGRVGFKNTRKKTAVCGQTVGLAVGMDLLKKGHKNACIIVSGQGAGRLPAMKGVQLSGVNIVSVTDMTYPDFASRPRKARRL
ncbi:28S ribosomal protein S11, mitochondrial-like [Mercenaria mercenaria]|uniref:28S ribosomal protein S11, mitochondrial-like n=1 Tax=Mercenaria mercenaria TaxID=6596 RepID=UPI00234E663C|nr:28S ribosomal protein S11, mitochondrial-like [Mercenaria mercenaria]